MKRHTRFPCVGCGGHGGISKCAQCGKPAPLVAKLRTERKRLRAGMKDTLEHLAEAIMRKDWSGARIAQMILADALEPQRRHK